MMRRILITVLSFSLAVPAWALKPAQTQTLNTFLKDSKIGSQSVSFKELFNKNRQYLSQDTQREFDLYLQKNPDVKMPKAKITKFQEGKVEVVEIEMQQGKDKMTMRIRGKGDFAKVTIVHNGKKIERRLGRFELKNPVRWLASFGDQVPWTRQVPSVQILSKAEIKKLNPKEKRQYIDRLRALLVAAEKAQSALHPGPGGKKTSELMWRLFEPMAHAAEVATGECIVAGWGGEYRDNSCKPPQEAFGNGCIKCNTDIYGVSAPCLGNGSGKLPLNATELCNTRTEETKYAPFDGVATKDDFQSAKDELAPTLTNLREKCVMIDQGGKALPDQASTCSALMTRVNDLENANCEALEEHPNQFPDLMCNPPIIEEPPVEPEPPPGKRPPIVLPPITGGTEVDHPEDCLNLPSDDTELECKVSQVRRLSCESEEGDVIPRFYCKCNYETEDGDRNNTNMDIGCSAKKVSVEPIESEKPKKKEPFIKPWMIGLGLGLVVLVMGYYAQQEMLKSYYAVPPPMPLTLPPLSSPTYLPGTR